LFDNVKVCADFGEDITESDEDNNCIEQMFTENLYPNQKCGCFETFSFKTHISPYDCLAVGNVIGDYQEEIVIAVDEDAKGDKGRFYIYRHPDHLERYFDARFTHNDRVAIGNIFGLNDGLEEIVVAVDEDDKIYIYRGDSTGSYEYSFKARFTKYDCLCVGDVCGDEKDEIIIAIDEDDKIYVYSWDSKGNDPIIVFDIPWNFKGSWNIGKPVGDHEDGMAVGNVFGNDKEEILLASRERDQIEIYQVEESKSTSIFGSMLGILQLKMRFNARLTPDDGFAVGDVLGDEREEILITINEDYSVYIFDAMQGILKDRSTYLTKCDGLAAGDFRGGLKDEIIIGVDDNHRVYIHGEED
jgi:hypothetical protein